MRLRREGTEGGLRQPTELWRFVFFLPQRLWRHKIAPYRLPAHLKTSVTPRVSGFSEVHDYTAAAMPPETGLHYRSDYFVAW